MTLHKASTSHGDGKVTQSLFVQKPGDRQSVATGGHFGIILLCPADPKPTPIVLRCQVHPGSQIFAANHTNFGVAFPQTGWTCHFVEVFQLCQVLHAHTNAQGVQLSQDVNLTPVYNLSDISRHYKAMQALPERREVVPFSIPLRGAHPL